MVVLTLLAVSTRPCLCKRITGQLLTTLSFLLRRLSLLRLIIGRAITSLVRLRLLRSLFLCFLLFLSRIELLLGDMLIPAFISPIADFPRQKRVAYRR